MEEPAKEMSEAQKFAFLEAQRHSFPDFLEQMLREAEESGIFGDCAPAALPAEKPAPAFGAGLGRGEHTEQRGKETEEKPPGEA